MEITKTTTYRLSASEVKRMIAHILKVPEKDLKFEDKLKDISTDNEIHPRYVFDGFVITTEATPKPEDNEGRQHQPPEYTGWL